MGNLSWKTGSADETIALGKQLAAGLLPPLVILLSGALGAGKTTLAKGIISGLGGASAGDVTSPTFTLLHIFHNHWPVIHVDLFRIEGQRDLASLGLEDLFSEPAIILIEWPERLLLRTNWPIMKVSIDHENETTRRIQWIAPE